MAFVHTHRDKCSINSRIPIQQHTKGCEAAVYFLLDSGPCVCQTLVVPYHPGNTCGRGPVHLLAFLQSAIQPITVEPVYNNHCIRQPPLEHNQPHWPNGTDKALSYCIL